MTRRRIHARRIHTDRDRCLSTQTQTHLHTDTDTLIFLRENQEIFRGVDSDDREGAGGVGGDREDKENGGENRENSLVWKEFAYNTHISIYLAICTVWNRQCAYSNTL